MVVGKITTDMKAEFSLIGIATGYGLVGSWIGSLAGKRFSVPVQTVRGAHKASCTISICYIFL